MRTKTKCLLSALLTLATVRIAPAAAQGQGAPAPAIIGPGAFGTSSQTLDVGRTIKREIRGGEGHAYEVSMTPGQYALLRLDIKGPVDLAAYVINPSGQRTRGFAVTTTYKPSLGYVIADVPGLYRILVTPVRPPLDVDTYEITLEELRPATEKDRALIAAIEEWSALSAQGAQAIARQDGQAFVETHGKMLAQVEKLDKRDATYGLTYILSWNMSQRLVEFKQTAHAETVLKNTLAFFDRVLGPESFQSGEMIGLIGDFYSTQNRPDDRKAMQLRLERFVQQDLSDHDPLRVANMYLRVGGFQFSERRYFDAVASHTKGREFVSMANGFQNQAVIHVRILLDYGAALSIAGSAERAIAILNEAHEVLKKSPEIPTPESYKVRIDYLIGVSHMRLGDLEKAKSPMEDAVAEFAVRPVPVATLRDRLLALTRLRMRHSVGPAAASQELKSADIIRELLPELKRIASSSSADYKSMIRQLISEAPETDNSKELEKVLNEGR